MTTLTAVSGFCVVRRPEMNFDGAARGAFSDSARRVGNIRYGGFDRMAWFDIDELKLGGHLPAELRALRAAARAPDFSGIDLVRDATAAQLLLAASNRAGNRNEIIALASEGLAHLVGTTDVHESQITWIGFDVAALGHSSLLLEGVFAKPQAFIECHSLLNVHGLLDTESNVEEYLRVYRALAEAGEVESIIEEPYPVQPIHVARTA